MRQKQNRQLDEANFLFWRNYCISKGELRSCRKGERLFGPREESLYMGYVFSGALKLIAYDDDYTEHILGLFTKNDFVTDYPLAQLGDLPSFEIVAESDCSVCCVRIDQAISAVTKDTGGDSHLLCLPSIVFRLIISSYVNLHTMSPEERYYNLIEQNPDLLKWFSLRDIASFLNISQSHLSRIRKKSTKN